MKKQYISDTCEVICEDNGRKMVADILSYREGQYLAVSLEKQLKLELKWNGKIFEGRLGKMSFVSEGPSVQNVKQGRY
jgi:hypothetical protein